MNNLVLGGEGMIGKYLVKYLQEQNETVYSIDIKKEKQIHDLRYQSEFLQDMMFKADFVYFLAFDVGGSKYLSSKQNDISFIRNNFMIMDNVFNNLFYYNKPFIFTSSQMSNMLESTYGNLKLVGEKFTKALGGMIAKFWNVYGIQTYNPISNYAITDFIQNGLEGSISMRTNGKEKRQFLHARDASKAMVTMRDNYESGKSYDVTSFEWITINEVATMISNKLGCNLFSGEQIDSLQRARLEEPNQDILNIWKPEITLDKGLDELIEYYKGN